MLPAYAIGVRSRMIAMVLVRPCYGADLCGSIIRYDSAECLRWVTGGKTPSENMFSELLQFSVAFVLQITGFWVRAIPR